ncbi:MAG TPA: hypothetical protein VGR08_07270, partial [Thermomicrobiales bacterium]|nr:hypothetical protein [Thermomicrobiales bacterium]
PAGCALLLIAEEQRLQPPDLASPETAFLLTGAAIETISPWHSYGNSWLKSEALRHGPRLRPLATAILEHPAINWWWDGLDRNAQLSTTQANGEPFPAPDSFPTPHAPPDQFERYAQHPARAVYTSTAYDGQSALLVAGLTNLGDWLVEPPIERKRVRIHRDARVMEIHDADSWHRFVLRYPADGFHGMMPDVPDTPWGRGGGIVPDWAAAARKWDGVHVSLWGMLMIEQVRVTSDAGWTEHWGQFGECTLWLRDVFTDVEHIEPIRQLMHPEHVGVFPAALIPPNQRHPGWPAPPPPD